MVSKVRSLGIQGIGGYEVLCECFMSSGLPAFDIVGLPDAAVKEARDRVRAAIKNAGFVFPASRITVNLAPADTRKGGTVYDLPVLLGILTSCDAIDRLTGEKAFIGELSLSGELRPITGSLPMALAARRAGIKELFVPEDNAAEAAFVDDITVYGVKNVRQLLCHLEGSKLIPPTPRSEPDPSSIMLPDFADVKGQENVKRALEIAAAGGHNVLMVGPPGAGKSMLSKRIPSILPEMTREEIMECTEVHSVAGLTSRETPIVASRPFRSPHHNISGNAMVGGGSYPKPGEISLAHNGVLFLDELPEFERTSLESLRQPLEDGRINISRAAQSVSYPARFMLVCAMNPCKCGWFGHPSGRCRCSEFDIKRYHARVSGPMLDRIDLYVEVPALEFDELNRRPDAESSEVIQKRVNAARKKQRDRLQNADSYSSNAYMGQKELSEHCALTPECEELMRRAFDSLGLTARSYDRILRVARTIADLDGSDNIDESHIAEAVQYRTYDFRQPMEG